MTEKWQWNVAIEIANYEFSSQQSIMASPCGKYLYVAGITNGQAKFHNFKCGEVDTEVAMTSMDFGSDYSQFIAKMTTSGEWLWVASINTNDEYDGLFITVDKCGDVILQVNVQNNTVYKFYNVGATEPSLITTEQNSDCIVVAKINQCGQWRWLAYVVSDEEHVKVEGHSCPITVDNCNNIIISGNGANDSIPFFHMANLDGSIKNDYVIKGMRGVNDQAFLAKLDTCGRWLWVAAVDSYSNENSPAVVVDKCNNIYFACNGGEYNDKVKFYHAGLDGNTITLNPLIGLKSNVEQICIGKLDPCGRWFWTAAIESGYNGGGGYYPCLALDDCDNLLVVSAGFDGTKPYFYNAGILGNTSESVAMVGKKSREFDNDGHENTTQISVAKLSSCGKWIWNASMDSQYYFNVAHITTNSCGDAYVAAKNSNNTNYPGLIGLFDSSIGGGVDEVPSVVGNGWNHHQASIGKIDKCGHWKSIYSIKSEYTEDPVSTVDKCNNVYVAASTYVVQNENNNTYTPVGFYQGTNTVPTMSGLQVQSTRSMLVIGKIGRN